MSHKKGRRDILMSLFDADSYIDIVLTTIRKEVSWYISILYDIVFRVVLYEYVACLSFNFKGAVKKWSPLYS